MIDKLHTYKTQLSSPKPGTLTRTDTESCVPGGTGDARVTLRRELMDQDANTKFGMKSNDKHLPLQPATEAITVVAAGMPLGPANRMAADD